MRTAEQKATEFMEELEGNSNITIEEHDFENIKNGIILLLKHQDRDTRHACTEAVMTCPEDVSGECIWKDEAQAACMNVSAV